MATAPSPFGWAVAFLVLLLALASAACSSGPEDGGVDVLTAKGEINPVMANYLKRGLREAKDAHATAIVIKLDTPGGLDTSMRDIVQAIDNSPVPVVVYVAPAGARAASAGTFITLAGHIAAMSPNTGVRIAGATGGATTAAAGSTRAKARAVRLEIFGVLTVEIVTVTQPRNWSTA